MDYCSAAVEGRNQNSTKLLFVNVTWKQIFLGKNISASPLQNISKGTCHSSFMKRPQREYKLVGNSISLKLFQIDCLSYCVSQKSVKFPLPDSPLYLIRWKSQKHFSVKRTVFKSLQLCTSSTIIILVST